MSLGFKGLNHSYKRNA